MEYVFFAGANGSGKSTLIKNLRSLDEYQGFRYICADEIEALPELLQYDKEEKMKVAGFLAKSFRSEYLQSHQDIIYESVASHPSHLDDLDEIKSIGYKITTIYVTTENPEINIERISKRGRDNDSYLTPERVTKRYYKSLDLLSEFIKRSDVAIAYDNTIDYMAVFTKLNEGKNILLGEKKWADQYIVNKLKSDGYNILTREDMSKEEYEEALKFANKLFELSKEKTDDKNEKYKKLAESLNKEKVLERLDKIINKSKSNSDEHIR